MGPEIEIGTLYLGRTDRKGEEEREIDRKRGREKKRERHGG